MLNVKNNKYFFYRKKVFIVLRSIKKKGIVKMVFEDESFDTSQLGYNFVTDLEELSNLMCLSVEENGENRPLADYLDRLLPLYFSAYDSYANFLLLFLFSESDIQVQKIYYTSDSPLTKKTQKDLMFLTDEIIILPETIQSFFSALWNHYGFSYEEFFLSERLLKQKMYYTSLTEKLQELRLAENFQPSNQNLEFILLSLNAGLEFLHNSICIRERFIGYFLDINCFKDFQVDFFRLILSLDYGINLLAIELIKLKVEYNQICKLNSK